MMGLDSDLGGLIVQLTALLIVTGVAIILGKVYSNKFSKEARGLRSRIHDMTLLSANIGKQHEMQYEHSNELSLFQKLAHTLGVYERISIEIVRAGVKLSITDLVWLSVTLAVVFFIAGYYFNFGVIGTFIFGLCGGFAPALWLKFKARNRLKKIEKQLPDALDFLVRTLQVGHGLVSIFNIMGEELADPIKTEFKIVGQEIGFGLPFTEAMFNLTNRINSTDFNFLVVGLLIQRESGGNLIELLQSLAKSIRARLMFADKIDILASEGRYAGIMLSGLPFVVGGIITYINPQYMSLLWTTSAGQTIIKVMLVMILAGGAWMWKITQIKV